MKLHNMSVLVLALMAGCGGGGGSSGGGSAGGSAGGGTSESGSGGTSESGGGGTSESGGGGTSESGGGGGGATTPSQPQSLATVSVVLDSADSKLEWNLATAMTVTLRDAGGAVVAPSQLTCTATDAVALTVAADCSSVKAHRLGAQQIQVAGNSTGATLSIPVIPQRQPIAIHGAGSNAWYSLLVRAGNVLAWGGNSHDVFGQGATSPKLPSSSLPVMVKNEEGTGVLSGIVSASGGSREVLALTETGEVYAWGEDQFGTAAATRLPVKVRNPANNGALQHIVQVSIGDLNSAALADDGSVYTWGYYTGQGTAESKRFPNQVKDPSGTGVLKNIVAISAGYDFTLALSVDGTVFAWGGKALPETVKLASSNADLSDIVAVSAGYDHSLALTGAGKVYAWGRNFSGGIGQQVELGSYPRAVPVKDGAGTGVLSDIRMVSAGGGFSMALTNSGQILSWGSSSGGKLGDGANGRNNGDHLKPLPVVGRDSTGALGEIAAIGAGSDNAIAIAADGQVLIWGDGFAGNLGQGGTSTASSGVPLNLKDTTGAAPQSLAPLAAYRNIIGRGR